MSAQICTTLLDFKSTDLPYEIIKQINTDIIHDFSMRIHQCNDEDYLELKNLQYDFLEMARRTYLQRKGPIPITTTDFEGKNLGSLLNAQDSDWVQQWAKNANDKYYKEKYPLLFDQDDKGKVKGVIFKGSEEGEHVYCPAPTHQTYLKILDVAVQNGFDVKPLYEGDPIPNDCKLRLTNDDIINGTTKERLQQRLNEEENKLLESHRQTGYRLHVTKNKNNYCIEMPDGSLFHDPPMGVSIIRTGKPNKVIKTPTWDIAHRVIKSAKKSDWGIEILYYTNSQLANKVLPIEPDTDAVEVPKGVDCDSDGRKAVFYPTSSTEEADKILQKASDMGVEARLIYDD